MSSIKFPHIASTYNEYLDSLYAYALHMGFDDQTSMDAIHDVFYKLCTHHSSLNEIGNLKFYLFRSLRNRLIDLKRTNRDEEGRVGWVQPIGASPQKNFSEDSWEVYGTGAFLLAGSEVIKLPKR